MSGFVELVDWAEPVGRDEAGVNDYRDTGEGGMFAYATWNLTLDDQHCVVDTYPMFTWADCIVGSVGPDERPFREFSNGWCDAEGVSVSAAVFLGSTGNSLYSDADGCNFIVTRDTLTAQGRALVDMLTAVYGEEPTFTTYLDT